MPLPFDQSGLNDLPLPDPLDERRARLLALLDRANVIQREPGIPVHRRVAFSFATGGMHARGQDQRHAQ